MGCTTPPGQLEGVMLYFVDPNTPAIGSVTLPLDTFRWHFFHLIFFGGGDLKSRGFSRKIIWSYLVTGPTLYHPFFSRNSSSRWWFLTFFIFTPTWGNDPIWLIFFKWVEPPTSSYKLWFFGFLLHVPWNHLWSTSGSSDLVTMLMKEWGQRKFNSQMLLLEYVHFL